MLGFKSEATAAIILAGIEMIHMMRKRQARYAYNPSPSIAESSPSLLHDIAPFMAPIRKICHGTLWRVPRHNIPVSEMTGTSVLTINNLAMTA